MSNVWSPAGPMGPPPTDAPFGRAPSGRPLKTPPPGWVPSHAGGTLPGPPPPRERSYVWAWVVGGIAAALVVIAVLALLVGGAVRDRIRLNEQAAATTVSMPPKAGGLVRSTDPKVLALARGAVEDERRAGFQVVQAAGYARTPSAPVEALAWGRAVPVSDPQDALRASFAVSRRSGTAVVGVAAYPPGPLGGSLQCGELEKPNSGSLCGWADNGAVVLVVVPGRTPAQAAPLVLRMRGDIEHRAG